MTIRTRILLPILSAFFINAVPGSALAATTLVFNVDSTISTLDTSGSWNPTGTSSFQVSVTFDETQYVHSTDFPIPSLVTSYQSLTAPMTAHSGESADALAPYSQAANLTASAGGFTGALYQQGLYNGTNEASTLEFVSRISDYYDVGSPYIGGQGVEVQDVYDYSEGFRLYYNVGAMLPVDPVAGSDVQDLLLGLIGVNDAFTFNHFAKELTDTCLIAISYCLGMQGGVYQTASGLSYTGTATLVSVSAVPVPAAAWLFGSAVLSLFGVSFRRNAIRK